MATTAKSLEKAIASAQAAIKAQMPAGALVTKAIDWSTHDTGVEYRGNKIVLPAEPGEMSIDDGIITLHRIKEQEAQKFDTREILTGAPWDCAVAFYRAMQKLYGVVLSQDKQTWFGPVRPEFITVHVGPHARDRIQIPTGAMTLPNVSEPVELGIFPQGAYLSGVVKKADKAILVEIAAIAREFLRDASIYRGKAIRLGVDDDGDLELSRQPEFIDLEHVREADMIHTNETGAMIATNIFAPLKNTQACRKNRIPLKRGILLEGKYGTGKSLTARVTAKVCVDNGWTFVMLDRAEGLKAAIEFARTYQPCLIFAEDIDRAADRSEDSVNDLVNMLDGLITKDMEIMSVLTTNFIEKIDRALLRPGRFDAIVSIQTPDAETAVRLIKAYTGKLLQSSAGELLTIGQLVEGWIPATIREVCERAKLSMLTEDRDHLVTHDLDTAARGMARHMALLEPKVDTVTAESQFFNGLVALIARATGTDIDTKEVSLDDVARMTSQVHGNIIEARKGLRELSILAKGTANSAEKGRVAAVETLDYVKENLEA